MGRREFESKGSRLRAARREHEISLTTFAPRVGYSRSYLSAVELGHLPETELIVMAYEAALGLERGSLTEGKQSVARILHRVSNLSGDFESSSRAEFAFPEDRMVMLPRSEVLQGMTSLAKGLLSSGQEPAEVFLSSFSEGEDWKSTDEMQKTWTAAQHSLLRAGWAINHLIRLSDNVGRSLLLMESMLGLLSADTSYRALYAPTGTAMPSNLDYFVVPNFCALLRFDTATAGVQGVLLIRDPAGVEALVQNCQLLKDQMNPLIEAISRDDPVEFERHLSQTEQVPGDRVLVRDTLPIGEASVIPPETGWLPSVALQSDADRPAPFYSGQRLERFLSTVKRYRIRQIFIKDRIEASIATSREIGAGLVLSDGDHRFQPLDVKRRLEQILELLKVHENYELALLDQDEVALIQAPGSDSVVFWLVQGNELLLESWPRVASGEARHLHIAVHEASIATAFMEHFKNVWARVNPLNREKKFVIWWLEQQIASLTPYT